MVLFNGNVAEAIEINFKPSLSKHHIRSYYFIFFLLFFGIFEPRISIQNTHNVHNDHWNGDCHCCWTINDAHHVNYTCICILSNRKVRQIQNFKYICHMQQEFYHCYNSNSLKQKHIQLHKMPQSTEHMEDLLNSTDSECNYD